MKKLKSNIIHVRKPVSHVDNSIHNYVWYTFKKGEIVPESLVPLIEKAGGQLEDIGEEEEETQLEYPEVVQDEDIVVEDAEEVEEDKPEWNEKSLFALRRDEQVKMLYSLNAKKIPRFEKDRVKLILALLEEQHGQ